MTEDIEKIFKQESREKKIIGYGLRGRASRTGRKGPVLTPVDFLKGKEKRLYKSNGKVDITNMYDTLPDKEHFFSLSKEDQSKILKSYRRRGTFTNKQIYDHLGIKSGKYYGLLKLPKKKEDQEMTVKPPKDGVISSNTLKGIFGASELQDRLMKMAEYLNKESSYTIELLIEEREGVGE